MVYTRNSSTLVTKWKREMGELSGNLQAGQLGGHSMPWTVSVCLPQQDETSELTPKSCPLTSKGVPWRLCSVCEALSSSQRQLYVSGQHQAAESSRK